MLTLQINSVNIYLSLLEVLCDPTDLIWRKVTPFLGDG